MPGTGRPSEFVNFDIEQTDDTTIAFELVPGIMWYDGTTHEAIGELDAEDVKFSLERMKVSEWKDKAVALDHVDVTGTHSGVIHLNQPFAPVWLTWLCDGTGAVLSKKAVEMAGGKFDGIFNFYCGPYRDRRMGAEAEFHARAEAELARLTLRGSPTSSSRSSTTSRPPSSPSRRTRSTSPTSRRNRFPV